MLSVIRHPFISRIVVSVAAAMCVTFAAAAQDAEPANRFASVSSTITAEDSIASRYTLVTQRQSFGIVRRFPKEEHNPDRHFYLKTNLPAWALLLFNIEGEADICHNLSFSLSVYYSGLDYFRHNLKFRTLTFMPELRYWPRSENDGFFVGAHFGLSYYNIALSEAHRYQDHDGKTPAVGGGLTIGYRLPLRNPRWKMEFSAGAGIYSLDYDIFDNRRNGKLLDRRKRTFYGLDRVAVSLCYTFGKVKKKDATAHAQKKGGDI